MEKRSLKRFSRTEPNRAEPTVQPDRSIEIARWSCSDLGALTVIQIKSVLLASQMRN